MSITPAMLGSDEDAARRLLVLARSIAPCIQSFPDGSEEQKDAIAILKGVLAELPAAGSGRTRSMSRNGTAISYDPMTTAFTQDVRDSLATLCADATTRADQAMPVGSFPTAPVVQRVWPEGQYS